MNLELIYRSHSQSTKPWSRRFRFRPGSFRPSWCSSSDFSIRRRLRVRKKHFFIFFVWLCNWIFFEPCQGYLRRGTVHLLGPAAVRSRRVYVSVLPDPRGHHAQTIRVQAAHEWRHLLPRKSHGKFSAGQFMLKLLFEKSEMFFVENLKEQRISKSLKWPNLASYITLVVGYKRKGHFFSKTWLDISARRKFGQESWLDISAIDNFSLALISNHQCISSIVSENDAPDLKLHNLLIFFL